MYRNALFYIFILQLLTGLSGAAPCTIRIDGTPASGTVRPFWQVANFAKGDTRTFAIEEDVDLFRSRSPFCTEVVIDYALGGRYPDSEEYYFGQHPDGRLITSFDGLLRRIEIATEAGLKPWIGLENVPPLMCDPVEWSIYGTSCPPADYDLFSRYVRQAMEAMVEAFGRETVASWNFFIATEPDLNPGHWTGTKAEFLKLLDHTLEPVLEVLPEATISPGNILNPGYSRRPPQTSSEKGDHLLRSRDNWGLDIIDHMAVGSLNTPGTAGSKMDYFSYSWYARIGRKVGFFDTAISLTRERLARYTQYKDLPIDVREFGILGDEQRNRLYANDASEWGASFYAAIARRVYEQDIRYVFEWDHATMGVLHPRGQVIAMLDQMRGGQLLTVETSDPTPDSESGAIACRKAGDLLVLIYHHQGAREVGDAEHIQIDISVPEWEGLKTYTLTEWQIDREHASWIYAFLEDAAREGVTPQPEAGRYDGSPRRLLGDRGVDLFQDNIERYRELARLPRTRTEDIVSVDAGHITIDLEAPCHSVRLLRLSSRK